MLRLSLAALILLFCASLGQAQGLFQHRVNEGRAPSSTMLNHGSTNNKPDNILIVMPVQAQFKDGFLPNLNTSNSEPIVVVYVPEIQRWAIRPENDQAKLILGMGFNVMSLPPNERGAFIHTVNDGGRNSYTVLDHAAINGNRDMVLLVTKGSESTVRSAVGVYYHPETGKWRIANANGKAMVDGEKYHVYALPKGTKSVGGYRAGVGNDFVQMTSAIEQRKSFNKGTKSDMKEPAASFLYFATETAYEDGKFENGHPLGFFSGTDGWYLYNRDGVELPQVFQTMSITIDPSTRAN